LKKEEGFVDDRRGMPGEEEGRYQQLGPQLWGMVIQYYHRRTSSAGKIAWAHSNGCLHAIWDLCHPF